MVDVMEHIGERLDKLQLPMVFTGHNTFVWLENILEAAVAYSSNLSILSVFLVEGFDTRDLFLEATTSEERSVQKRKLRNSLQCNV